MDADRIFGAVCDYLLIGLTWALVYGALDLVQPGSFDLGEIPAMPIDAAGADPAPHFADMDPLLYYSLVTLSTLGYGDIVAVTRAARSLSALEAIVGQLYIAVVVARLIGLHILARRLERPSIDKVAGRRGPFLPILARAGPPNRFGHPRG